MSVALFITLGRRRNIINNPIPSLPLIITILITIPPVLSPSLLKYNPQLIRTDHLPAQLKTDAPVLGLSGIVGVMASPALSYE